MTLYAVTATGWRAITDAAQAVAGETVMSAVPQSLIDALAAAENQQNAHRATLRQQAETALVDLRAYRDLASPTNAQTLAAVKLLCRVCIGLIRLALVKLDGAD